jgi:predicted permease
MRALWQDVRYGFRMIVRNPGLAVVVIASLALGITLNTVIFSIADGLWLRPMPFRDPGRVVRLFVESPKAPRGSFSFPVYLQLQSQMRSLVGLTAVGCSNVVLLRDEMPETLPVGVVSRNFFTVLGIRPYVGRFFREDDEPALRDQPGVVLSDALWQRRFGGDANIIGKPILLSGQSVMVLGVAPPSLTGTTRWLPMDLWWPAESWGRPEDRASRQNRWFALIGRLQSKATVPQARAEAEGMAGQLELGDGAIDSQPRIALLSAKAFQSEGANSSRAIFLMAIAATVLVIACANVSGLLLARAQVRHREMAIRSGLGAGRGRLMRQLLIESLWLSLLGLACSLVLAYWLIHWLPSFLPSDLLGTGVRLDRRVLMFAIGTSLAAVVLFGLAPALGASHASPITVMRAHIPARNRRNKYWGFNILVVTQFTLALILVGFASLLVRSLVNITGDLGFERKRNVLVAHLACERGEDKGKLFFRQLVERVRALPGVKGTSAARLVPLCGEGSAASQKVLLPPGHALARQDGWWIRYNTVDPDYLRIMGIRLLRGRGFDVHDDLSHPKVVLISAAMARQFWPEEDPLGKQIWLGDTRGEPANIVGVVEDVRYSFGSLRQTPEPYLYVPFAQVFWHEAWLQAETQGDPMALLARVRREIRALDQTISILQTTTVRQFVGAQFMLMRAIIGLVVFFGLVALGLASVGLYGVVSYAVSRRTQEVGIRMVLGARRSDVLKSMLWRGCLPPLIGAVLGLPMVVVVGQIFHSELYRMRPADPLSICLSLVVLLAVCLLASYIPARRAAGVDPMVALRCE